MLCACVVVHKVFVVWVFVSSMIPLWEIRRLTVPKNIGFVTSESDLSVARQLRSVAGHAVRVGSYDDLLSRVWRSYSGQKTACVPKLPEVNFAGGVDAYVLDGVVANQQEVRDFLARSGRASLYLPRLNRSNSRQLFERVQKELSVYNPLLSV